MRAIASLSRRRCRRQWSTSSSSARDANLAYLEGVLQAFDTRGPGGDPP
jgi:hypothetical protein